MGVPSQSDECRVLLFTPTGRDSALIAEALVRSDIPTYICRSITEAANEMAACAMLVVAEEALNADSISALSRVLENQPNWSDLPIIVLTSAGEESTSTDYKLKMLEPLGNVSLVERPVRPSTLVSIVRSALRARDRQYQFREQTKALERFNEDLQRFANIASHDLQEPLRTIASYSQLLARRNQGKLNEESQIFLEYILNGVERMRTLIHDLLEFSRHTSRESLPPVPVDCNAVLKLALEHLRLKIAESEASVAFDHLPTILAHETPILQVFQNLIGNALKYCEKKPQVTIAARPDGDSWIISVRDNGIGIAPQYQERVFGLFQRLHTRDEYPGSGLGLATCKRIVERYGGRIWVESKPGEGSTFYFTAPAYVPASKDADFRLAVT